MINVVDVYSWTEEVVRYTRKREREGGGRRGRGRGEEGGSVKGRSLIT